MKKNARVKNLDFIENIDLLHFYKSFQELRIKF